MSLRLLFLGTLAAIGLIAQAQPSAEWNQAYEKLIAENPTYSTARAVNKMSPEQLLTNLESRLSTATSPYEKSAVMARAAKAALEAGQNTKAQSYASDVLKMVQDAGTGPGAPNYARRDAIFYGNLVLGRLALLRGDVESAKTFLLRSGQIGQHGSGTFDSFGPNMSLARELLKKSEDATVLQFLEECRQFWTDDAGRIDSWEVSIRNHQMPHFNEMLFM